MRLAARTPATVINADSAQVYADLKILSARPDAADTAAVPHRLFGYIDGAKACSAAAWAADAIREIDAAHAAGRLPIVVGGTGLYIRTLLNGIAPVPEIDPAIRAAVRALSVAEAHAALAREDPPAAARLAPADTSRVARALEVVRSTGRPLVDWQAEMSGGISARVRVAPMLLLPPREWLFARCDTRFAAMLETGAVAEVEQLIARNLDPALPVMRAIGVREIAGWLAGTASRNDTVAAAQLATRRYAKRQFTWFSRQPPDAWPRSVTQLNNNEIESLVTELYKMALTL